MIEHTKLFYANVKDAIRYSTSDKFAILAMGVFFTFLAIVEEATTSNTILAIIYLIILVALLLFESGYSSKITEETIQGSTEPPRIGHFFEMCRCGISEACVIFTYSLIGVICSDIMEHFQYDFIFQLV